MTTYNFLDRTNEKHGRLIVSHKDSTKKRTYWVCNCECGNVTSVRGDHLKEGRVISCGCYSVESHLKHGHSTREKRSSSYISWQAMKARCYNNKLENYKYYGGRGITVCDEWIDSFENFYADMGDAPKNKSIDRIDNDKGYSKENCKWSTPIQQIRNRRNSILITHNNKTLTLKEWCIEYEVTYTNILYHYKRGKDPITEILRMSSK